MDSFPTNLRGPTQRSSSLPAEQTRQAFREQSSHQSRHIFLKRTLDVCLAFVASIVSLPLCVVIALLIKIDSDGPVIFSAARVGKGGRIFKLYKFRSMVEDAEERLKGLVDLNRGGTNMVKIPNDPRVTRVGKVLRKYSLDEIPQFWNVILGDMSLVGPRPQSPDEVSLYDDRALRRLTVPAGLTGWWQVTARDDPRFDIWVAKDLEYIDRCSMRFDLKILLKTVTVVFRGKSASPKE